MFGLFSQLLVNGLVTASLYALYGVSWGVIYRTTRIFHFSHLFVFAVAGYSAALVTYSLGLPAVFGFIASIIMAILFGCGIDAVLYRNLRKLKATQTTTFLASMGFATAGLGLIQLFFTSNPRPLAGLPIVILSVGAASFTIVDVIAIITSWTIIAVLLFFLSKSRYGKAIQAVGSNSEMSRNIGINIDRIYTLVFALGSAAFGIAAFLFAAKYTAYPMMGMVPFFMSFTAVFLGGVTSIKGHALSGFLLGLTETLGVIFLPGEFKIMLVFGILIIVIILKPEGLMSGKQG